MREALRRGLRTAIQSFAGTLAGVTVVLDASFARDVATAALGGLVAGLGAFAVNLEPAGVSAGNSDEEV